MDEKKEPSATRCEKIMKTLRYITVEPVIVGTFFVMYLYSMIGKQYIFYKLALDYNLTKTSFETSCNETIADENDPDYILFQQVSTEASQWVTYLSISVIIPSTFMTILFGSWSDKFGRKFPMLMSLFGFIILILTFLIVIIAEAAVPYLLIGHIICGFFGDVPNLLSCSFSLIADIAKPQNLTFRFTVVETCIGIGGFISSIAGGVWLAQKGFVQPFWFMLALCIINFLYVFVRFDSSNKKWFRNLTYLFSKQPFVHIYEAIKPKSDNKNRHISIILYLTSFFLLSITTFGVSIILVVYEIGLPFCWNPIQVGISQSLSKAGYFIILAIVKIFSDIRWENKLVIVGTLSNAISCFILAFAVDDWMIYLGLVIQMIYLLPSPILRSQLSRLVSHDEIGPVFALQASTDSLSIAFGSALFNSVFGATVNSSLPGAAFLLSPMLLLIFLPVFRVAYMKSKHVQFNKLGDAKIQHEDKL